MVETSMTQTPSPGARFRAAIAANKPLQIVGTINAYTAMMAQKVGHQAIYLPVLVLQMPPMACPIWASPACLMYWQM